MSALPAPLTATDAEVVATHMFAAAGHLEAAGTALEAIHGKGHDIPEQVLDLYDRLNALMRNAPAGH